MSKTTEWIRECFGEDADLEELAIQDSLIKEEYGRR